MSRKKKVGIVLIVLLALILIAGVTVYFIGHKYYSSTNYMSDEEVKEWIAQQQELQNQNSSNDSIEDFEDNPNEDDADEEDENENDPKEDNPNEDDPNEDDPKEDDSNEEIDEELEVIHEKMELYASEEPITTDGNVYNILLIGVDTKNDYFIGNSDSMILISVNYKLRRISMVSLMRDTHVFIPNIGYRKLNAAHANGGGPLLLETIEYNYKIDIDRYVTVNFGNMIDIIDEIGTIEITFTDAEAENANKSIKQQCRLLNLKYKEYKLPGGGTYQCNGMQAVAYARIRKVGNADYQRTERQREVLMKLLQKIKAMDLKEIDKLATHLLPFLTHNVPESEFWGLLAKVPNFLRYNIIQDRIPYNGMYVSVNGNLAPDWEPTVEKLKKTLYGEDYLEILEGNPDQSLEQGSDEDPDDSNNVYNPAEPDKPPMERPEDENTTEPENTEDSTEIVDEPIEEKKLDSPYKPQIFTFKVTPLEIKVEEKIVEEELNNEE